MLSLLYAIEPCVWRFLRKKIGRIFKQTPFRTPDFIASKKIKQKELPAIQIVKESRFVIKMISEIVKTDFDEIHGPDEDERTKISVAL